MPVNVDVQIQRNQSLKFPTVTICNKNIFNATKFELLMTTPFVVAGRGPNFTVTTGEKLFGRPYNSLSIGDVVGFNNMTAEGIWSHTAHVKDEMIIEVSAA